jgi:diguanylate cyclase (GGDEF)-like protein/PAS domain S-box-containing protein
MRLASIKPWHQRFAGALFLILARTTCHGQGTASDSPNAIFGCSIAQVRLSVSHVSLAFLKAIDTSTLAMTGLIAMSSIAVGVTSLKFARGHRVLNTGATTAARRSGTFMRALRATAITGFIMCVFDVSKMTLYPNGQIWASHTITILFAALLVSIVSLYVLKNEERIRLEIASTEARYKLLFERSLTGAYRTALDGRVLDCNVSFCQMFGYSTRKEVTGGSVNVGYFSTSDRVLFIERLQAEKSLTNFEQRLKRKDGSPVWVLNSATLLTREDGTGPVIKGTMTDISELRRAEQQNRRLAAIVNCSDDAILSLTLGGVIESWNHSAERIYGYTVEEAIGRSINIVAPGDRSNEFRQILERVGSGHEVADMEAIRVRKDGKQITISFSVSPITDSTGVVVGASSIARDITDRKRSEEALRKSEVQYRLLFESNPFPMWVFDRNTLRFLAVNQAAIRQYGFSEQEFLAMTVADIRPEEDIPDLLQDIATRDHGLQKPGIRRHRKKNGAIIDVEIVSHDLDFQGIDAMLVAAYDVTEQKRSREMLQDSENKYHALFADSADAYWLLDETGYLDCNWAALEMFGFASKDDFKHPADISPPHQPDGTPSEIAAKQRIAAALLNGKERFEWLHQRKNGEVFPTEVCLTALTLGGRRILLATVRDITERKQAEEALLFKTALLEAQSETTIDGILAVDESDHIILANRQFGLHFGIPDELLSSADDLIVRKYVTDIVENNDAFLERIKSLYAHPDDRSRDEVRLKNGKTFDRYSAPLIDSKSRRRGRIWYFRDITDRKAAEERIQFLAYFDALTELPNRTLLKDRLLKAVAGARRRNEQVALLFLDIDHFKLINDSLGHTLGDRLLKDVAARLKGCVREQDTVARVGGDEFVVVLSGVKGEAEAATAASRIVKTITGKFVVQGHSLNTSCSLGISMFPQHSDDCDTLIKYADQAMYSAKENGRNNFQFFKEDMNTQVVKRLTLENDLRLAIEREEFFLVYQPQMEISSGRIIGLEALIRWQHPKLGLVPPDKFIPITEKTGLILPIGEWVLKTACSQARKWLDDGIYTVPVAVNVSAVQFRQEGFCELIKKVLQETCLPPQYLELELTESLLLSNEDVMFSVLQELKEMGLKLAIDDFGTGYSSLSYLKQFPVNKLKIDRSFIRDISTNSDDAAITTAIINMAKSLNLKVIAEGVETEAQMSFLREHRCDEIQGYYFSKPISAGEVADKVLCAPAQQISTVNSVFQLPASYRTSPFRVQ